MLQESWHVTSQSGIPKQQLEAKVVNNLQTTNNINPQQITDQKTKTKPPKQYYKKKFKNR